MNDQNKALLDRLEVVTLGLDEDCGEPGCPDCKPWRPVWDLMKDLRTAIDKPPAQLTHAEGCWSWGPAHYECACRELAKAKGWAK
jgi:hypothetical protein